VRQRIGVCIVAIVLAVVSAAAQAPRETQSNGSQFVGTWSGRWDGGGASGGFELTIESKENTLGGGVSVTGEPTYKATLKKLAFDGNKMNAAYDFTPDEQAEVVLAATFDGDTAKGTWSLRAKADGTEVASGTWNVTKSKAGAMGVSLRRRLRTVACCGMLEIAALFGMPMRPEQVQEFMQTLNESRIAHTLPSEDESGDPPPDASPHNERIV